MKITKPQLKRIIKEEIENAMAESEGAGMVAYDDQGAWDSDPNLAKIEQILNSEFDLKDFKFHLMTDFPGQYSIADRGDLMGLRKKTGIELRDVKAALQANGYKTSFDHDGLTAFDPRYKYE